jgi:hypothetical protein
VWGWTPKMEDTPLVKGWLPPVVSLLFVYK